MPSIGSFGVPMLVAEEPDTFEFFGSEFRIDPAFGTLMVIDVLERWEGVELGASDEVLQLKAALRAAVLDADFPDFWETAVREHQSVDELMRLYQAVARSAAERETERPTERPSASSDGPGVTLVRSESQLDDPAMERLAGRPDLQLSVLRSRRAVSA